MISKEHIGKLAINKENNRIVRVLSIEDSVCFCGEVVDESKLESGFTSGINRGSFKFGRKLYEPYCEVIEFGF
ncbi:MAG: hypothetical protein ACRCX2_13280 [Paraclostridium sp.]